MGKATYGSSSIPTSNDLLMADQDRHISVWNECLGIFEKNVDPKQFEVWFKTIAPKSIQGSTLTVEVPTDFFRNYLEDTYLPILKATLRRVIGPDAKLVYVVRPVRKDPMEFTASNGNVPENKEVMINTFQTSGNPNPFAFPGLQKVRINPRLNPVYCFENIIKGECNKMAFNAGLTISEKPGKTPFNPLFIFGGPGLGKTHLAQAVGIAVHEAYPDLVVLYVTGNEFKTQYVNAVKVQNKLTDFMAFYMRIDVLIVDDIQELVGPASQNAFFNIFNSLHQSGKQLVFTSDRAPVDLMNFEERLLSRFKWGLSVELSAPDYRTRLECLRARCNREGVPVREEVLELIAKRVRTNFRELEGALISLIANATLCHEEITLSLAEQVTGHIVGEVQEEVTLDKVQDTVCNYFNITRETLLSKSRKRQIVQARQIAMYLSRNHISNCSLSTIGNELGGKDHATVLHACTTVSDLMTTDKLFRQYVTDIERILAPAAR